MPTKPDPPADIVHHDRKKHHTRDQRAEYNIFRDSPMRYLGYANEVGESFRYQFPRFVLPSYGISFGYCLADAVWSGKKAYDETELLKLSSSSSPSSSGMSETGVQSAVVLATVDTLIWQSLASVMIPGATINMIVNASRYVVVNQPLPTTVAAWLPTAIGLGSIPLIIHPIDTGVDYFMETTFRKMMGIVPQDR
jgi:fission process protein 1